MFNAHTYTHRLWHARHTLDRLGLRWEKHAENTCFASSFIYYVFVSLNPNVQGCPDWIYISDTANGRQLLQLFGNPRSEPPVIPDGGGGTKRIDDVLAMGVLWVVRLVPDAPNSGADPNAMIIRGCAQYEYLFDLD